jgi:hypothetical protein
MTQEFIALLLHANGDFNYRAQAWYCENENNFVATVSEPELDYQFYTVRRSRSDLIELYGSEEEIPAAELELTKDGKRLFAAHWSNERQEVYPEDDHPSEFELAKKALRRDLRGLEILTIEEARAYRGEGVQEVQECLRAWDLVEEEK